MPLGCISTGACMRIQKLEQIYRNQFCTAVPLRGTPVRARYEDISTSKQESINCRFGERNKDKQIPKRTRLLEILS